MLIPKPTLVLPSHSLNMENSKNYYYAYIQNPKTKLNKCVNSDAPLIAPITLVVEDVVSVPQRHKFTNLRTGWRAWL